MLRIASVTFQNKPLREPIAIFWDRQRTLPRYAKRSATCSRTT
jgi:hypothetical protein